MSLVVALAVGGLIAFAANWLLQDRIENGARSGRPPSASRWSTSPRCARQALASTLLSRLTQQVIIVLIPPLALIFLVLGTIFLGIATPTEGGAMGAAGALILAFAEAPAELRR